MKLKVSIYNAASMLLERPVLNVACMFFFALHLERVLKCSLHVFFLFEMVQTRSCLMCVVVLIDSFKSSFQVEITADNSDGTR
jgi:hypothetical protein